MRRRGVLNLVLLAAVIGLVAVLLLDRQAPSQKVTGEATLTPLARDDIQRIRIEQADAPAIALRRSGQSDWLLTEPVQARAEASEVAPLLRVAQMPSHRRLPASELDLSQAGLHPPLWTLRLNELELNIGDPAPTGNQRYVQIDDQIHLTDEPATHAFGPDYAHFIARRLLPEAAQITLIQLPDYELRKNADGNWHHAQPSPGKASASDLAHTADAWQRARGLWIAAAEEAASDSEDNKVRITLEDGRVFEFTVVAREPQLILGAGPLGVNYHLAAHQAAPLLDLEHPDSADLAVPDTLKTRPDVEVPSSQAP